MCLFLRLYRTNKGNYSPPPYLNALILKCPKERIQNTTVHCQLEARTWIPLCSSDGEDLLDLHDICRENRTEPNCIAEKVWPLNSENSRGSLRDQKPVVFNSRFYSTRQHLRFMREPFTIDPSGLISFILGEAEPISWISFMTLGESVRPSGKGMIKYLHAHLISNTVTWFHKHQPVNYLNLPILLHRSFKGTKLGMCGEISCGIMWISRREGYSSLRVTVYSFLVTVYFWDCILITIFSL